jgi:hypothetical protein
MRFVALSEYRTIRPTSLKPVEIGFGLGLRRTHVEAASANKYVSPSPRFSDFCTAT